MAKVSDFRGINEDYNRQLGYNKKHGGVSDALKKRMPRPEKDSKGHYISKANENIDFDIYNGNFDKINWDEDIKPPHGYEDGGRK